MQLVTSLADPRLDPYRNLKDRELARAGGRFIAEGELVVRRLLNSDYPTESVLLSERRAAELAPLVPSGVPVYVAADELMRQVIGYKFHSGVIAVGVRKPPMPLEAAIAGKPRATLVILPETANAENLGSMVRLASAFGADALLLGERCCDPFWRQAVRVSMGNVFRVPIVQSRDLMWDLRRLRQAFGFELAAAVLDDKAEPLARAGRPDRFGILFGNEAQGLDAPYAAACDRRVTIPMNRGTDSLNVAVAAGIFLYHFA